MTYIVTWSDEWSDDLGSGIDLESKSFADHADAISFVHELTTHPYTCDGVFTSNVFDVELSVVNPAG